MSKYRIQKYRQSLVIPSGSNKVIHTSTDQVNGILKGIVVRPPASITGSSYGIKIIDDNADVLFSKASLAAGSNVPIMTDANDMYINIPISNNAQKLIQIDSAGTTTPSGTLTSDNSGNVTDGKLVTIGDITYTFKTAIEDAYDVLIGSDNDDSLLNLKKAINKEAGEGTKYGTGTIAHPDVTCGNVTAHAVTVTAVEQSAEMNALPTTTDDDTLSWGGATLADGGEAADRTFGVDLLIQR